MFLLILLFFFTNVYLWHDTATRQMDSTLTNKMNSRVDIQIVTMSPPTVAVTNNGGVGVSLSRLWIITSAAHTYYDFEAEGNGVWVSAGETVNIPVSNVPNGVSVTFKVLTTLGNSAACQYTA
jgi:hypothetical protein